MVYIVSLKGISMKSLLKKAVIVVTCIALMIGSSGCFEGTFKAAGLALKAVGQGVNYLAIGIGDDIIYASEK